MQKPALRTDVPKRTFQVVGAPFEREGYGIYRTNKGHLAIYPPGGEEVLFARDLADAERMVAVHKEKYG